MRIDESLKTLLEGLKSIKSNDGTQDSKPINSVIINQGGTAAKKVENNDIEKALNETSGFKAIKGLLAKSPIGLTKEPDKAEIENMGYLDTGMRAFHKGAPIQFSSTDGGTITVYDGNGSANMGENERKVVYENGRYKQEMFYDEKGNLVKGKIVIRDEVGRFTEEQYDFIVENNDIKTVIR